MGYEGFFMSNLLVAIFCYLLAIFGSLIVVFFELFKAYPSYFLRAIFNFWGCLFLIINSCIGFFIYLLFDSGVFQVSSLSISGLSTDLVSNQYLKAFIIGFSCQVFIRSKLTVVETSNSDSTNSINSTDISSVSTSWDEYYRVFRYLFYDKIDRCIEPYVTKDAYLSQKRAQSLMAIYSIDDLKLYISQLINSCRSKRIKIKISKLFDDAIELSKSKGDAWLHFQLAVIFERFSSKQSSDLLDISSSSYVENVV